MFQSWNVCGTFVLMIHNPEGWCEATKLGLDELSRESYFLFGSDEAIGLSCHDKKVRVLIFFFTSEIKSS